MSQSQVPGKTHPVIWAAVVLIVVSMTVTSAQVTFSRQWVRGKYPGGKEAGENLELKQAAKAALAFDDFVRPNRQSDVVPVFINVQMLEEIFKRIKDTDAGRATGFPGNVKK